VVVRHCSSGSRNRVAYTLYKRAMARPYRVGKALRVAVDRASRNSRDCAPENQAKCPYEIWIEHNEARQCHTKTQGHHAEENTRPEKLGCLILCSLAEGQPSNHPMPPEQHEHHKAADKSIPTTYTPSKCFTVDTKHSPNTNAPNPAQPARAKSFPSCDMRPRIPNLSVLLVPLRLNA
jgi:hypothetical protein